MVRKKYNSAYARKALKLRRRRRARLFMFGSLFSVILVMIMTFALGGSDNIFGERDFGDYSQISGSSINFSSSSVEQSSDTQVAASNGYTICVDPGHGFDDPGTSYDGVLESEINLAVALKLRDLLVQNGFEVIMTHETNSSPDISLLSLDSRCQLANSSDVDLYISLHCNSYEDDESVSGIRLYHYTHASEASLQYAETVAAAIASELDATCPVFGENYQVTREVSMPSILVEMGFITNEGDRTLFQDEAWQEKMAAGAFNGIKSYCETYIG